MLYLTLARFTKPCGIQYLQVIDYCDPAGWTEGAQIDWESRHFGEQHRIAHLVLRVGDEFRPRVVAAVQPWDVSYGADGEEIQGPEYQPRSGGFLVDELSSLLGIADLAERMVSDEAMPVLDGTGLSVETLHEGGSVEWLAVVDDTATISAGSYTIGSGQDYATIAAFSSDLANSTGSLTGTISGGHTETVKVSFTTNISTYSFSIVGSGFPTVVFNHNEYGLQFNYTGSGILSVSGFKTTRTQSTLAERCSIQILGTATSAVSLSDLEFDCNDLQQRGMKIETNTLASLTVYNMEIYNPTVLGVNISEPSATFENVTVYAPNATASGIANVNLAVTYRNVVVYAPLASSGPWLQMTNATLVNCATDQASITGGSQTGTQVSITTDDWQSVTVGNSNFLKPANPGKLYGTGANPAISGHTTYINGVAIVTGDVDIGAKGLTRSSATGSPFAIIGFPRMIGAF